MTTRRSFLRAGALAATGLAAARATIGTASAAPDRRPPTFLFAPGSHGNAQYLAPVTAALTTRGFRAETVEPPGHGLEADFPSWFNSPQDPTAMATETSAMASVTLAQAVDRVVAAVRQAAAHGPVVLVGHSLGGAIIGAVGNAVPHLISRLVYLSAFCPVTLPTVADYTGVPENDGSLLKDPSLISAPLTVGALRVNWRSADPVFLGKLRTAYLADGTDAQLRALIGTLQPDESLRFSIDDSSVQKETWGRIPRTYVKFTLDKATPIPLQNRFITDADALTPHNRFVVHELAVSHLGFVLAPNPLADILTGSLT